MLRARHKGLIVGIVLILLAAQPVIFASIPVGTGDLLTRFIVKKGTNLSTIAAQLKEEGLINSKYLFLVSSLLFHRGRVVAGEYELSNDLSIRDIARKMANGERKVYTLRIVEGYNLYTIGTVIERAGIMEARAFIELTRNQDFLKRLDIPSDSLEGYLAPDSYFFSKETNVDEFLEKIVQRTFKFFEKEDIKRRMNELHMSMFEVLSLASIVEKEARLEEEKGLISAVFHNRLRKGMSLDADPTVIYGLGSFGRDLKKADLATVTPYNTYRLKGLPKGPICSPSRSSITAALHPEQSEALYFVSRNDGSHIFSKTMEEHNRYVTRYQKHKNRKP